MKTIRHSRAFDQEAAARGSAFHGQPSVGRQDGARVHLHPTRGEGRHLEGHPIRRHEG